MSVSDYVIPVAFLALLIASLIKKKNAYSTFADGSKQAVDLACNMFPYLLTVMVAVHLFRASGLAGVLADAISPMFNAIGIPPQLCELLIIRPVSGSGALAVLENVYATYGADSFIGCCASVIYGSSETVFYVCAVYLSRSVRNRTRYAIPVALISTAIGYVVGCAML